jgi:patatin-like phospholipase/acyl hydrolase
MQPLFIVTCDGGGIRGLITALLIQALDKQYSILKKANLYAGTSTGGIIALGLASDMDISTIVNIYATQGPVFFDPLDTQWGCILPCARESLNPAEAVMGSATSVFRPSEFTQAKYNNVGPHTLESVLQQYLPAATLESLAKLALVTTFQLSGSPSPSGPQWTPLHLDNLPGSSTAQTTVLQAALCTSAAPLFFPPYQHPTLGYCVDGGLFANNPSVAAIARALAAGYQTGDITLLSVGVGNTPSNMQISHPLCTGIEKWLWPGPVGSTPAYPLFQALLDGLTAVADSQCSQILGTNNYLRVDIPLPQTIALDDYHAVPLMEKAVTDYMATPAWTAVKNWVASHFNGT